MADDIVTKTKTYTDKVRNAIYGKEVRSSIADGIDGIAQNVKDEIARDELSKDVEKLDNNVNTLSNNVVTLNNETDLLKKSVNDLENSICNTYTNDDTLSVEYNWGDKTTMLISKEKISVNGIIKKIKARILSNSKAYVGVGYYDSNGKFNIYSYNILSGTSDSVAEYDVNIHIKTGISNFQFILPLSGNIGYGVATPYTGYKKATVSGEEDFSTAITTIDVSGNRIVLWHIKKLIEYKKNTSVITVGKNGSDYKTINEALSNANDSVDNPVTIMLYPGIYDEVCNIYGNRNISIIGINRDKCIIRDKSGKYINSPVRVSGNFTLENLTIIANGDNADPNWDPAGYNPSGSTVMDYPSYAIHIDDTCPKGSVGYIRNCTIYSECLHAVGMGLHNNQTVIIENCTIERKTTDSRFSKFDNDYRGAMGCHSLVGTDESEEHLIVKNTTFKYNNSKAFQLYKYNANSPMDATFINCTFIDGNGIDNVVYFKNCNNSMITNASHGNSTDELNYRVINS